MSVHSASGTTPFEVVYGRPPSTLHNFLPSEIRSQAIVDNLRSRDEALALLKHHLMRAQHRITMAANRHRRDFEYAVGDLVFLKFIPYRQSTLFTSTTRKLAPRYFGPFSIEARVSKTAYRLKLPDGCCIQPVFYASLLKKAIGSAVPEQSLLDGLLEADPPFLPEIVLDHRSTVRDGVAVEHVLIKWEGVGEDEATWMDVADVRGQFPYFRLGGKAVLPDGAVDTEGVWRVYTRGSRGVVFPT